MTRDLVVIKYGGHAMDRPEAASAFMRDIASLAERGWRFVLVHGGGPQINALLARLHMESRFEAGLRVTDEDTMRVVEMVLAGQVNKSIVSALDLAGVRACGISGRDGGVLRARRRKASLGLVGDVAHVEPALIHCLLSDGFVPVVAPVGQGPDGEALNINADTAAGALAGALAAACFVLVSDVPGVLDAEGHLVPRLDRDAIAGLCAAGVITGGMIPKTEACLHALEQGARQALILDGRAEGALGRCLEAGEPLGTLIRR